MTAKQEYDWESLRAEINARFSGAGMVKRPYAQFALFVYLTGNVNGMNLLYAGFTDVNWNNRTLSYWRRDNFLPPGDTLDAQTLTAKFPEIADLLPRLQAGEFTAQPVIHTNPKPQQPTIQPHIEEISMQPQPTAAAPEPPLTPAICQKTAGCKRNGPFPHRGRCTTMTEEERKAHKAKLNLGYHHQKKAAEGVTTRPRQAQQSSVTRTKAAAPVLPVQAVPVEVTTVDAPRLPVMQDERVPGRFQFHFAPDDGSDRLVIDIRGRASVSRNDALGLMGNVIDSEQSVEGRA